MLIAEVMSTKGYRVQPLPRVPRHDIVQVGSTCLNITSPAQKYSYSHDSAAYMAEGTIQLEV
jgi:hypothetical protein